jgi:hypothetical protein
VSVHHEARDRIGVDLIDAAVRAFDQGKYEAAATLALIDIAKSLREQAAK